LQDDINENIQNIAFLYNKNKYKKFLQFICIYEDDINGNLLGNMFDNANEQQLHNILIYYVINLFTPFIIASLILFIFSKYFF